MTGKELRPLEKGLTPEEREKIRLERIRRHIEEITRSKQAREAAIRSGKLLTILTQAFYGNRTVTGITPDMIDSFILGFLNSEMAKGMIKPEDIDRTIVRIPDTEKLVLIYNRYQDEKHKKYGGRMTANIPELGLELNSRCIVCRMNDDGSFSSIRKEDFGKVMKYLAE